MCGTFWVSLDLGVPSEHLRVVAGVLVFSMFVVGWECWVWVMFIIMPIRTCLFTHTDATPSSRQCFWIWGLFRYSTVGFVKDGWVSVSWLFVTVRDGGSIGIVRGGSLFTFCYSGSLFTSFCSRLSFALRGCTVLALTSMVALFRAGQWVGGGLAEREEHTF